MGIMSPAWDDNDWNPSGAIWSVRCKSDSRFDGNGSASGLWTARDEIDKHVLGVAKRLDIEPPDDIEISAYKD